MPAEELLIARIDGRLERRMQLDPGRAYSIGRSNRCDLAMRPKSISRRHALLVRHAGRWLLLDTGSRRGLATPEGSVRQADLLTAGWVSFGPVTLSLVGRDDEDSARAEANAFAETVIGLKIDETDEAPKPSPSPARPPVRSYPVEPLIVIDEPERAGAPPVGSRIFDLHGCDHATLGTDRSCAVRLPAGIGVAPLHAVLYREPRAWAVIDAGGGLYSEGRRWIRRRLEPGITVELGGVRVRTLIPERPHREGSEDPEATAEGMPPDS